MDTPSKKQFKPQAKQSHNGSISHHHSKWHTNKTFMYLWNFLFNMPGLQLAMGNWNKSGKTIRFYHAMAMLVSTGEPLDIWIEISSCTELLIREVEKPKRKERCCSSMLYWKPEEIKIQGGVEHCLVLQMWWTENKGKRSREGTASTRLTPSLYRNLVKLHLANLGLGWLP